MAKFSTVPHETLRATVYNEVKNAILNGDFYPGDTVKIRQIAEQMGVSATPVRDALLHLVMERVLIMPNSREIRVADISDEEFHEIRSLRIMLEGEAAEAAATVATPQNIKKLEDINAKIEKAFERKKPKQALTHNRAFHAYLYGIANMTVLMDVVDRLWLRMAPVIASWSQQADADDFTEHHIIVIDRLKKKDGEAARKAIAEDIFMGGEKIKQMTMKR